MQRGRSSILFSATLSPLDYFTAILGGNEATKSMRYPHLLIPPIWAFFVADWVSTKYRDRERSLRPVAELLKALLQGKREIIWPIFPPIPI